MLFDGGGVKLRQKDVFVQSDMASDYCGSFKVKQQSLFFLSIYLRTHLYRDSSGNHASASLTFPRNTSFRCSFLRSPES